MKEVPISDYKIYTRRYPETWDRGK